MPKYIEGRLVADGLKVAIVVSRFNSFITEQLVLGAVDALVRHGVRDEDIEIARVPGTFELPQVARRMALTGRYDALVALGAVIRGGTPHFDYVCQSLTHGLTETALRTAVPVGNGVLTCDTLEQALDRAGLPGSSEDKGWEAVVAALDTALVLRGLRARGAQPV